MLMKSFCKAVSLLFPSVLISCNNSLEGVDVDFDGDVQKIQVVFNPLQEIEENGTRSIPSYNGTYSCLFFNTDTLGIFSFDKTEKQKSYQLTFPVDAPAEGSSSFSFSGGGWYMSMDYLYQAYTPYNYNNKDATAIPLNFIGQKQSGKNNMDMLGPFYFATSQIAAPDPTTHDLKLSMSLKPNVARFLIKMPITGSLKKLYLITDGEFALKSTYDMETETFGPNLQPSHGMCLNLESVNVKKGEEIMFFMCICPVDLTGKKLDVALVDDIGNKYLASYGGKKAFNATKAKGILYTDFDTTVANNVYGFVLNNSYVLPNVPEITEGVSASAPDFNKVG